MRAKIMYFFVLMFVSKLVVSKPWYEYADNAEVGEAIKKVFIPNSNGSKKLSENLYLAATETLKHINSTYFSDERLRGVSLETDSTEKEAGQCVVERWKEYESDIAMYVAFLIKASDRGHVQAKIDLGIMINTGLYGVDKDELTAQRLFAEALGKDPCLAPKPLKWFVSTNIEQNGLNNVMAISGASNDYQMHQANELFKKALRRLAGFDVYKECRAEFAESYIFLLKNAAQLGHVEAKKHLSRILHEGTYGVKRDNRLAASFEREVEALEIKMETAKLSGLKAEIVANHTRLESVHYNPVSRRLEIGWAGKTHYFIGNEAQNFYRILDFLRDMEKVD